MTESRSLNSAIVDADNFLNIDIPPKETILNPWLREESIILISGWRGTGKTWFGLSVFDAISRSQQFGPWQVETPVGSLYVDGEMTASDIQGRLLLLDKASERRRRFPFAVYSDAYANSLGIPRADLRSESWRTGLKQYLLDHEFKLVAFDNIASLCPGLDENAKKEWDPINQWLLSLRFQGITSILLHHTNKNGDQRGTSAREDNIDISIILFQPSDYMGDQGARFVVKFKKSRINTKDLVLMEDLEFRLIENDGRIEWSWGSVKRRNKAEILRMLNEGMKQVDITTALNVDKGYVSRVRSQAIKDGHLSNNGRLTKSGFTEVNLSDEEG